MIFGLLIPILLIIGAVIVGRKVFSGRGQSRTGGFSIRRLFQYLLLFSVLVISAIGVSGLLGRALDSGRVIVESRTDLARNLTFTIVGVPILWGLSRWTRRSFAADPHERSSFGWNGYLAITSLAALATAMYGVRDFLMWAIGNDSYRGAPIARAVVWGGIWYFHWHLSRRTHHLEESRLHLLAGSLIGLGTVVTGLSGVIGHSIEKLINWNTQVAVIERTNPIISSAIILAVGLPVWFLYWFRAARRMERDIYWYSYIFLAGIASGFIATVVSSSIVIYDVLVWFFGDVGGKSGTQFFYSASGAIGSGITATAVWLYHREVLEATELSREGTRQRTELRRIYEYIVSGVSLIATAVGLLMIIVAVIESITPKELVVSTSQSNTLIVAVTLLIVGAPIWWYFWNRIERNVAVDASELVSMTRRIFLFMLFGVAGIAAIASILTGVFLFMDDLLNGSIAMETLRRARFAIAILLTNGAISWYHWSLYRSERHMYPQRAVSERHIVLVGPADGEIARELKSRIGGSVELWISPDGSQAAEFGLEDQWNIEKLIDVIEQSPADEIMVLNEKRKLRAIPISREKN